jgi:osmotically-inducible protein OsmY
VTNTELRDCVARALDFPAKVGTGHIAASADGYRRSNLGLRTAVLKALILDKLVPGTVVARVHDGLVTLVGSARWHYQREEAELVCASVPGVIAVRNEISLTPRGAHSRGAYLCGEQ